MNNRVRINLISAAIMVLIAIMIVVFIPKDVVTSLRTSSGLHFILLAIMFVLLAVIETLKKQQKDIHEHIHSELDRLIEKAKKTHAESVELNKLINALLDNDKRLDKN